MLYFVNSWVLELFSLKTLGFPLLLQAFLNRNSYANGHTDHGVVASAQEAHHPNGRVVNTYLGNQFRTDMVVYEITLDSEQINVDTSGLWIRRAGQTLAEAMTLAGGRLLDIEFSEIKSGYRLRYSPSDRKTFVDIFLFDSLSSGAGYCSALAEKTRELMSEARKVLSTCSAECDSACHECLMHYCYCC